MQHSATVIALFSGPADWCIFTRTHHQLFVWSLWSAEPITLGTHCVLFSLVPWHLSLAVLMPPPPWSENTNQAHGKRLLVLLLLGRRKPFFSIYILIVAVEVSKFVELPFVWKNQQRNAASPLFPWSLPLPQLLAGKSDLRPVFNFSHIYNFWKELFSRCCIADQ